MAGSDSAYTPLDLRLRRFLVWAILLLTAGYTFLDYWEYSRVQHADPQSWALLAHGQGLAPAQYRIGVYYTANVLAHYSHLQFRHLFALSDFLCTSLALSCLCFLLTRLTWFRQSELAEQWAQVFVAFLLVQIYLVWTLWFQEPETMPSFAVLGVAAFLYWSLTQEAPSLPRAMLALSLLLIAALGATIRADIVTALTSGVCLAALGTNQKTAGRGWLLASSLLALFSSLSIEYFITHQLFPHAVRSAPAFQLIGNLRSANGTLALLCTLPAWALTVWLSARNWSRVPLWLRGLILGSVLHFLMFLTFGMSEEVRIFLPFTLVLVPLSAILLYRWLSGTDLPAGDLLL